MKNVETKTSDIKIRLAEESDVKLIYNFIKELAEYEKLSNEFVATEEILLDSLFVKHQAEAVIGEYKGKPVGFALFFNNFSTFLGKSNLYLEDIYIQPQFRGVGLGKAIFSYLAQLCVDRGYGRMDWCCLDWNESSIHFYKKMGAKPMSDWTIYRMEGQELSDLANRC